METDLLLNSKRLSGWGRAPGTCLLLLDDVDAGLDVGEGVHGGEDGLPLVLLAQLAARPPALGEGRGVHEAPQVEVLLEVGQAVLHLVVVEVGLHVGDLDVRLPRSSRPGPVECGSQIFHIGFNIVSFFLPLILLIRG